MTVCSEKYNLSIDSEISNRVSYYIADLKIRKWNLFFEEEKQITCFFDLSNCLQEYKENSDFIRTNLVDKDFTVDKYRMAECERKVFLDYVIDYEVNGYIEPMILLFNSDPYFKKKKIIFRPDDVYFHTGVPIITKTRPLGNSYNVLINLDAERHWNELKTVDKHDISFKDKNNKIIWRGASNGFGWGGGLTTINSPKYDRPIRKMIAEKYWNHPNKMIDVGLINNQWTEFKEYNCFIKQYIPVSEQLQSKFIISVEGADVATNLKWILYSNSVVIMPTPTMCSWIMEDTLKPWVHYVPLEKDFDDLEEKYNWCLNNLDKCEEMAKNGKKYIEQFLDADKEKQITNMVLREYVDNVTVYKTKSSKFLAPHRFINSLKFGSKRIRR